VSPSLNNAKEWVGTGQGDVPCYKYRFLKAYGIRKAVVNNTVPIQRARTKTHPMGHWSLAD